MNILKNEIKNTISFIITSKRIKYLGINLMKPQEVYTKKHLWNKLKIYMKGNISHVHRQENFILRCQCFPKWSTDSMQCLSNPSWLFVETDELILKFMWNCKGHRIPKNILKKKNKVWGLTLLYFKPYYQATIIRIIVTIIVVPAKGWTYKSRE